MRRLKGGLAVLLWSAGVAVAQAPVVVAGGGPVGHLGDGGPATDAWLAFDPEHCTVWVDDTGELFIPEGAPEHSRIRRVDEAGIITTYAGNGEWSQGGDGGPAVDASVAGPAAVYGDAAGNIYISDTQNGKIRRVDAATGVITTVGGGGAPADGLGDGGAATLAQLGGPRGIFVDGPGNIYIADRDNHRIRRIDAETQVITTVAGSGPTDTYVGGFEGDGGPATLARLDMPDGVHVDAAGNIFIAEIQNHRIRKVDAETQTITTVAGSGPAGPGAAGYSGDGGLATEARLSSPTAVSVDAAGAIYIADRNNNRVRRVDPQTQIITTVLGGVAPDGTLVLDQPNGLFIDDEGSIYVAEHGRSRIIKYHPNQPPLADAGEDQVVFVGNVVMLVGSGSSDPDADPLSYAWEIVVRPDDSDAKLAGPYSASPTFVADAAGVYEVQLVVNDGISASDPSLVVVTARTEQQAVQELVEEVSLLGDAGALNRGQENSLTTKLAQVIKQLDRHRDRAGRNQVRAFIHHVSSLVDEGVLSSAEGQALVQAASAIATQLSEPATKTADREDRSPPAKVYPNPFNASTTIQYVLREPSDVRLAIYNPLGQVVSRLVSSTQPAGTYTVGWDGRDVTGRKAAGGVYLYRLTTTRSTTTGRLLLLK